MSTTRSGPARSTTPLFVTSLAQIRGLASPARQEIVDAVAAMGPVSVAVLAQSLGRTPNAFYFHIRKLESLGLLVRRSEGGTRGRPSVLYDVPGRPLTMVYQPAQSRTKGPMGKLVRSMVSTAARNFARGYRPETAVVSGYERNLWAARSKRWLSPRELREVNKHLRALMALLNSTSRATARKGQLMELTFVLAPAPVQGGSKGNAN
jgi:DNA-binding transcriptional ArsR family regulator